MSSTMATRSGAPVGIAGMTCGLAFFCLAHCLPETFPNRIVAEPERQRLVLRIERLIHRDHAVPGAGTLRDFACAQVRHDARRHEARHAVHHRDVDLMAFTGFRLRSNSAASVAIRSVHARKSDRRRACPLSGRAFCFACQVHHAAVAFSDQVVAWEIFARAREPEARQRHEHEIGLDRLQRCVVDAELLLHARRRD